MAEQPADWPVGSGSKVLRLSADSFGPFPIPGRPAGSNRSCLLMPFAVIDRPPRVRLRWVEGGIPDQEPFMPVGKSGRQALRG